MNEIEQKQIEEMAKVLFDYRMSYDDCVAGSEDNIAKYLVEQGYRNVKDKVILSKEDYLAEKIYNTQSGFDMGKQEGAIEVCEKFKSMIQEIHSKVKKNRTVQMDYVLQTIIPTAIRLITEEYKGGVNNVQS